MTCMNHCIPGYIISTPATFPAHHTLLYLTTLTSDDTHLTQLLTLLYPKLLPYVITLGTHIFFALHFQTLRHMLPSSITFHIHIHNSWQY